MRRGSGESMLAAYAHTRRLLQGAAVDRGQVHYHRYVARGHFRTSPKGQPGEGARATSARAATGAATGRDPLGAPDPLEAELSTAEDRITLADWSRRLPPVKARIPEVRIGKRWY